MDGKLALRSACWCNFDWRFWFAGAAACFDRFVRGDVVFSVSTNARTWRTDGFGSTGGRRVQAGAEAGNEIGSRGNDIRIIGRGNANSAAAEFSLRNQYDRLADIRRRSAFANSG